MVSVGKKKIKKLSAEATLAEVTKEMAKPRIAKSARGAGRRELVFKSWRRWQISLSHSAAWRWQQENRAQLFPSPNL